jgi:hypothetical protein
MVARKTRSEIQSIISAVQFMDREFRLLEKGDGYLLQLSYREPDVETGEMALHRARKWYVSPWMTETEIVETAFKACRVSSDHVLKEHFLYKGRQVYSPHFDVAVRIQACDERRFDSRPDESVQTKAASTAAAAAIAPRLLTPPAPLAHVPRRRSVFLAGSIEMGRAENWQSAVALALADEDVFILNPRREDWDASWRQSMDEPRFVEQVEWELAAQERAAVIAMYFAPSTHAPISLLELGLAARSGKLLVCCPEGYWRKGNVEVVCRRYGVPLLKDLTALIGEVRRQFQHQPRHRL